LGRNGGDQEDQARIGGKDVDPIPKEILEVTGDGKGGSRIRPVELERPCDLEREEWISAGVLVNAAQERPRPRTAEARPKHRLECAEAQRSRRDAMQSIRCQRTIEVESDMRAAVRPQSEQESNRLVAETADGILEGGSRRSIEPLDVVHDHQYGPRARPLAEECEEGRSDGSSVEHRLRFLAQQRNGKGAALRRGKASCCFIVGLFEQVPERGE
jgi:hypothetical protein